MRKDCCVASAVRLQTRRGGFKQLALVEDLREEERGLGLLLGLWLALLEDLREEECLGGDHPLEIRLHLPPQRLGRVVEPVRGVRAEEPDEDGGRGYDAEQQYPDHGDEQLDLERGGSPAEALACASCGHKSGRPVTGSGNIPPRQRDAPRIQSMARLVGAGPPPAFARIPQSSSGIMPRRRPKDRASSGCVAC